MHYFGSYVSLLKRLMFILLIYSLCRLGFFLYNLGWYSDMGMYDIFTAFAKGVLFDLKTILYINLVFIFLSLLPFGFIFNHGYQLMLKVFFFVTNLVPLGFNIADYEYSKFIGKRSDIIIFGVQEDVKEQFGQMMLDFWYLAVILVFFGFIMWKFYPNSITKRQRIKNTYIFPVILLFLGLVFLGLRGSFKVKPLLPVAAYTGSPERATLMLNTPFCIIHTIGKEPLEVLHYFSDEELDNYIQKPYFQPDTNRIGSNIVILIVESLAPEFVGYLSGDTRFTPFIDSLASKGLAFRYGMSNGRTSQQAVPSILAGIPQLMDESIATSVYQTNSFFSLADDLKKSGYGAYFFHGGNNGTMGFDKFTGKLGYQYFGADEYPDKADHDGSWGIYDGPYLQYCVRMLTGLPKPFFAAIFTLSSHQPYAIPKDVKHLFTKGKEPIQNAVAYADYSIRGFFEEASKSDWYRNTLFVITADHTHPPVEKKFDGFIDEYRIPIIFYHPQISLSADTEQIVQQVDIIPSVADFLGLDPDPLPRFGKSVFLKEAERNAIIYNHNSYYLAKKGYYLEMIDGKFRFRDWYDHPVTFSGKAMADTSLIKAYRQYFNHNMVNNSFLRQ
ncbi:MAG: sulfatase-like hydrolase/transferase [Bacteroidales bacterium]|nr:sulfatase-like hydrolase/transferase [Bacteroidales bacterium]